MKNVKQNTVWLIGSEEWGRSYTTQSEANFHCDFLTQSTISFSPILLVLWIFFVLFGGRVL